MCKISKTAHNNEKVKFWKMCMMSSHSRASLYIKVCDQQKTASSSSLLIKWKSSPIDFFFFEDHYVMILKGREKTNSDRIGHNLWLS